MAQRGFDISQFRAAVNQKDILRTNKFLMEFSLPRGLIGLGSTQQYTSTLRTLEYWCEVSASPGMNFLTTDARRYTYGPIEKRPYGTVFTDLSVTFFEDGESDNWTFIQDWMRLINNSNIDNSKYYNNNIQTYPYEVAYRQEYVTDVFLHIFDQKGDVSRKIKFKEMYPISVADTALNWSDTNSVARMTVNFTYLEWVDDNDNFDVGPLE